MTGYYAFNFGSENSFTYPTPEGTKTTKFSYGTRYEYQLEIIADLANKYNIDTIVTNSAIVLPLVPHFTKILNTKFNNTKKIEWKVEGHNETSVESN